VKINGKRQEVLQIIAMKIPARMVMPAIVKMVEEGGTTVSNDILDILTIVGVILGNLEKPDLVAYHKDLMKLFLSFFGSRSAIKDGDVSFFCFF
jgi:hypothetical protein